MKRPDPEACAALLSRIGRGGVYGALTEKDFNLKLEREQLIRDALRFCAREPKEIAIIAKPQDKPVLYACYRIETEGEDSND